jgi:DNA-binding transcriptional LysR family regulator
MAEVDLNDVAIFVRVVALGSFAKAAREMRVPTSTVSRAIARLEESVGALLLRRTPRSVRVTAEGRAFYTQVEPAVAAVKGAAHGLEGQANAPQGRLRVTAPNDVGESFLGAVVAAFSATYPLVEVELVLTTRIVDLGEEGVDVALRAGPLPDSSLVARKLMESRAALYASPGYIAKHAAIRSIDALAGHACVLFGVPPGETTWSLTGPNGETRVRVRGRVAGDDYLFVRAAAIGGAGIALLPELLARPGVASGALVRVLPGFGTASASLHIVHVASRVLPRKVVAFRDFVVASCASAAAHDESTAHP